MPYVNIISIDAAVCKEFTKKHKILGLPTMLFIKDNEVVEKHVGTMDTEQLMDKISEHIY